MIRLSRQLLETPAFEREAQALRLNLLEMAGLTRQLLEEVMAMVGEHRTTQERDWEEISDRIREKASEARRGSSDLAVTWALDDRCASVSGGGATLITLHERALCRIWDLRTYAEALAMLPESALRYFVEPICESAYESLRSLVTSYTDGDFSGAQFVLEEDVDFQRSVQTAKASMHPYLGMGTEEANAASLLLPSVAVLEGLGRETTEAGRQFLKIARLAPTYLS